MARIFLKTYGCTLNQSDSELTEALLLENNHQLVNSESEADAIIVNTCAVKEATENKILHYLKKLQQTNKQVIVDGCLPPANLAAVKKAIPSALAYLGPNSINKIPSILENGTNQQTILKDDFSSKFSLAKKYGSVTARIQTSSGCLSNCTFCATKIARGTFESKPLALILNEARMAIQNRAKEIQLASQDNSCYGFDLHTSLPEVLHELNDLDGRFRIRVGMANPTHLRDLDAWIAAFKLPKVYKFLHLPFQSGSNRILKEMKRGYAVEQAEAIALEFRKKIPSLTIETDLIAGFPTETTEEFQETLALCKRLQFDVVNVSKYSKRPNTKAAKMPQLDNRIIKHRSAELNSLIKQISLSQNQKCMGETYEILVTENANNDYFQGRNNNYKPVLLKGNEVEIGQFVRRKISSASITSLIAE